MMSQVKIDTAVWDMICTHYANLNNPTPEDQQVQRYISDKLMRQIRHDGYMASKRLDSYDIKTGA